MEENIEQLFDLPTSFVSVDTETTGLYPMYGDKIIQLSATKYINDSLVDSFNTLINPEGTGNHAMTINNIPEEVLTNYPAFSDVVNDFTDFVGNLPWVGHNLSFDFRFLSKEGLEVAAFKKSAIDTLKIARSVYGNKGNKLWQLANRFNINYEHKHDSLFDSKVTASIYQHLRPFYRPSSKSKRRHLSKDDILVTNNSLSGAHFAYTGSFTEFPNRADIIKLVIKNGGRIPSNHSCTSVTDYLILGEPTASNLTDNDHKLSRSMINALKYKTNIISANEFISMLGER